MQIVCGVASWIRRLFLFVVMPQLEQQLFSTPDDKNSFRRDCQGEHQKASPDVKSVAAHGEKLSGSGPDHRPLPASSATHPVCFSRSSMIQRARARHMAMLYI